jgi:hypothetical protein
VDDDVEEAADQQAHDDKKADDHSELDLLAK